MQENELWPELFFTVKMFGFFVIRRWWLQVYEIFLLKAYDAEMI